MLKDRGGFSIRRACDNAFGWPDLVSLLGFVLTCGHWGSGPIQLKAYSVLCLDEQDAALATARQHEMSENTDCRGVEARDRPQSARMPAHGQQHSAGLTAAYLPTLSFIGPKGHHINMTRKL